MISSPSSPGAAASAARSVSAISDSGMPYRRSVCWRYVVAPAIAAANVSAAVAAGHISCSSRGGPGSTTTVGPPFADAGGTTRPGAVPTGSRIVAPSGTTACLRLDARTASGSRPGQRER